eukprot:6469167-Amphidinium_carterae.1
MSLALHSRSRTSFKLRSTALRGRLSMITRAGSPGFFGTPKAPARSGTLQRSSGISCMRPLSTTPLQLDTCMYMFTCPMGLSSAGRSNTRGSLRMSSTIFGTWGTSMGITAALSGTDIMPGTRVTVRTSKPSSFGHRS